MQILNELESKEIICSMITLYGATIFQQSEYNGFKMVGFIFIILINANFFTYWGYCFLKNIERWFPQVKPLINFCEKYFKFRDGGLTDPKENTSMQTALSPVRKIVPEKDQIKDKKKSTDF